MASIYSTAGVGYSKSDVFEFGSTRWGLRIVTDTDGTTTETFCAGPWRMKVSYTPSTEKKQKDGEDGEKLTTKTTDNYVLEITTGQKDLPALVEVMKQAQGKTTQFLIEHTVDQVGSAGKRIYSTCMGTPAEKPTIASDSDTVYKFDLVKATDDITIDISTATGCGFGSTSGNVTQDNGEFFGFVAIS